MWYQYLAAFWAGAFLGNFVPHFVHGVSGNKFPSPFANPPGQGLSSPVTNILWSLFNLLAGYLLFVASKADSSHPMSMLLVFCGLASIGIFASIRFQSKHKE